MTGNGAEVSDALKQNNLLKHSEKDDGCDKDANAAKSETCKHREEGYEHGE
jgi:hypothetical protein